jgi:hypothetical protein
MGRYDIKIRCLTGLLALFWALPAPAQEAAEAPRWYQVELIIFAQRDGDPLDSERWPEIAGITLPANLRELSLPLPPELTPAPAETAAVAAPVADAEATPPPAETPPLPEPFQILGEEAMQLNDMAAKIRRSRHFAPLLHIAWRQPTLDDEHARPILLYDGMTAPYSDEELDFLREQTLGTAGPPLPTPADLADYPSQPVYASEEDAHMGPPAHRLVGTVRLSVARYLHLDADLIYRLPVTQKAAIPIPDLDLWYDHPYPTLHDPQGPAYVLKEWQALRGFRLEESRRMRSKEIHYLDNPFFGVVVLVTPVELPEPEPETPDDPAAADKGTPDNVK